MDAVVAYFMVYKIDFSTSGAAQVLMILSVSFNKTAHQSNLSFSENMIWIVFGRQMDWSAV